MRTSTYDQDFYAWTQAQAVSGRFGATGSSRPCAGPRGTTTSGASASTCRVRVPGETDVQFMQFVAALRSARPNRFDWEHIALELEATGRNEWDQMENRVRPILLHLLKWQLQPWLRSRSWRNSLWVQRRDLAKLLRRNPSLRPHLEEALAEESHS